MGCGGSRLNAEREAIPAKLRPILRRRIEEIKRRRRSGGGKIKDTRTPSGKEFLLHDGKANDHDQIDNDGPEDSITSCVTSEDSKGSKKRAEEGDLKKKESAKGRKLDEGKEVKVAKVEGKKDEEDEEDEGVNEEESIMHPGSPSFRIFFLDSLKDDHDNGDNDDDDDNDDDNDDGGKTDGADDKTQSSDHKTLLEKSNMQESALKKAKKGRKRRGLKKVIPKGGQTAVKNLFNVRSCYTPSSHDRAHLLKEKTPA